MPANGKVSITWQFIIVLFVPIIGVWGYYRIQKLRKMILFITLPSFILMTIMTGALSFDESYYTDFNGTFRYDDNNEKVYFTNDNDFGLSDYTDNSGVIPYVISYVFFFVLSLYLVYRWTVQWNNQFN